jgi:peptide/nickel transport system permease protein
VHEYILRRALQGIATVFVVSVAIFLMTRISGDPTDLMLSPYATTQERELFRRTYGLDRPLLEQYVSFVGNAMRGDLGKSLRWGDPVVRLVWERFPNTLELALAALAIALVVGLPVGAFSALRPNGVFDNVGKIVALAGQSIPNFWLGIMLILLLAVDLRLLPTSGRGDGLFSATGWKHLVMPALTLSSFSMAAITRLTRSAMLDVLDREYIKMVRLKGASTAVLIWKHALKNALISVLTVASLQLVILLSGSVVIESVFGWPGMGSLAVQAVFGRDYAVVQFVALLSAVMFVTVNLLVDVLYAVLDPRIRYDRAA